MGCPLDALLTPAGSQAERAAGFMVSVGWGSGHGRSKDERQHPSLLRHWGACSHVACVVGF